MSGARIYNRRDQFVVPADILAQRRGACQIFEHEDDLYDLIIAQSLPSEDQIR